MGAVRIFRKLVSLKDVDPSGLADGRAPVYRSASGKFEMEEVGGGAGGGAADWTVKNDTGAPLPKGTLVAFDSYDVVGTVPLVVEADGAVADKARVMGIVKADISDGASGDIVTEGELGGLDTSAFAEQDVIYPGGGGGWSPTPSTYVRSTAIVLRSDASDGVVYVFPSMPVFQSGTGTGSKFFLFEDSLSAAASEITIAGLNFDRWDHFKLRLENITPVVAAQDLRMTFKAGAADITGEYKAGGHTLRLDSTGTSSGVDLGGTDYCILTEDNHNTSEEGTVSLDMELSRIRTTVAVDEFRNQAKWGAHNIQASSVLGVSGDAYLNSTSSLDGIKLNFAAGNIAAGATWKIWGVKAE
jgi:hypothetical protein